VAKIFTYLTIIYGSLLLLFLAGIPMGSNALLDKFDFIDSPVTLWGTIIALAALAVSGGLIIAALTKTSPDLYLSATFATITFIPIVAFFPSVIEYAHTLNDWVYYLTLVIVGVLGVGYIISVADWITNRGGN
jgi:hypothetical protein